MRGLQGFFPSNSIILWQTEHVWRRHTDNQSVTNHKLTKEKMNLAAIMVDTETFEEKATFVREIYAPFSKHSVVTKVLLKPTKKAYIKQIPALLDVATEFVNWSEGRDLYSWGDDYLIFVQHIQLDQLPSVAKNIRFHDIRHLFRAYGIPVDNYLSSTIASYFGKHYDTDDSTSVLDNCRMLAMALKRLAQTV